MTARAIKFIIPETERRFNKSREQRRKSDAESNLGAIDCEQTKYGPPYIQVPYRNGKAN